MMEEISKYENRHELYQFLIDDYQFEVVSEKYYPEMAGGYYVDLAGKSFLLRYYNDRNFLSIDIASRYETTDDKWYALSFIKDLIYNPENINSQEGENDNSTRIIDLNNFIRRDYKKIDELFNQSNYPNTKKMLDEGLKKQFYSKFPSAKPKSI